MTRRTIEGAASGPDDPSVALTPPAIRPDPERPAPSWITRDGMPVGIRPLGPEDEPPLAASLGVADDQAGQDRGLALVAERKDPWTGSAEILGVGRLRRIGDDAEFTLQIVDRHRGRGLGTELLRRLLVLARAEKIGIVRAEIPPDDGALRRVSEKAGFTLVGDPAVRAEINLGPDGVAAPDAPGPDPNELGTGTA